MNIDEPNAVIPVDVKTTAELVEQIRTLRVGNALLRISLRAVCNQLQEEQDGRESPLLVLARAALGDEKSPARAGLSQSDGDR